MSNSSNIGASLGEDMYNFQLEGKQTSSKIISKLNGTNSKNRKRKEKDVQLATAKVHIINAGSEPDK